MKTRPASILLGVFILLIVTIISCKKDTATTKVSYSATVTYSANIQPVISQNCSTSGCHDASSAGGYNLTSHSSISNNATIILKAIRHESGVNAMPQGASKLAVSKADDFDCWIQQEN